MKTPVANARTLTMYLTLSIFVALIGNSLLTRYVDPSGTFGVLFAFPMWFGTRLWGRKGGMSLAGAGVILNFVIYVALGDAFTSWSRTPENMAARVALEIFAFAAFVLIVDRIEGARRALHESRLQEERSRELLSASEGKYQTLVDLAPEGIVVSVDSIIVYSNARLTELSGYDQESLIGSAFIDYVIEEDRQMARARTAQRLQGRVLEPATVRYRTKSGEVRWLEVIGGRTEWEGQPAIMYLLSDVTERIALEQRLAQAQKMEAVGRLAGGIAHDFNNVLVVVQGYCEYITMKRDDPEAVRKGVSTIKAASSKAASLTQQLLAFSRKQVLQPEIVNLNEFLDQSVSTLRPLLGEDISVTFDAQADDLLVKVDPGQLQQVILNLAVNARDAMQSGGWLHISLRRVEADQSPSSAEISVADTGSGINESILAHVFEPFFTTKEPGRGTGLGLSIVSGIVEQSGGHIEVETTVGTGTTFYVRFPESPPGIAPPLKSVEAAEAGPGTGRILVLEDDPQVRALICDVLSSSGYDVIGAANGSEAVKIAHHNPDIHLLITDMVLPGMNGEQASALVAKELDPLRVIFTTGYVEKMPIGWLGDSPLLKKPFSTVDLLKEVRAAFRSIDSSGTIPPRRCHE